MQQAEERVVEYSLYGELKYIIIPDGWKRVLSGKLKCGDFFYDYHRKEYLKVNNFKREFDFVIRKIKS